MRAVDGSTLQFSLVAPATDFLNLPAMPFAGDTPASIIGAILKDDSPRLSTRLPLVPRGLDHLVDVCLDKDPARRWQSAADVAREAEWIAELLREPGSPTADAPRPQRRVVGAVVAATAIVMFLIAGAAAWRFPRPDLPVPPTVRFAIAPPEDTTLSPSPLAAAAQLAFSPDGAHLALVAARGRGASESDAANERVGTWNSDGTILFTPSPNTSTSRVPALGGPAGVEIELSRDRREIHPLLAAVSPRRASFPVLPAK